MWHSVAVWAAVPQDQAAEIALVEGYLNSLKTYKAQFEQYTSGARPAHGVFYLNRPRQFLWKYNDPEGQKIVSTGGQLFFVDGDGGQVTQLPLNHGPATLLTREHIRLNSGDIEVIQLKASDDVIDVELKLTDTLSEEVMNSVLLTFSRQPMQLRQMVTEDQLGQRTYVSFFDVKEDTPLPKKLFNFTPPQYFPPE